MRAFSVHSWRVACASGTVALLLAGSSQAQTVKADHTTLNVDSISQTALDAARALRMTLDHASVGAYILSGMEAMQSDNSTRYSFPNWDWHDRGNPGWQEKVDGFVSRVDDEVSNYDVFMMKFCYIDDGADWAYYRDALLEVEAAHPTKKIVWWTMPLETSGSANEDRASFNGNVRTYCAAHDKPLYDIADIESHDDSGDPVTADGAEAMFDGWSNDGGHLSSDGELRAAQGIWSLMTQLAGSGGSGGSGGSSGSGGSGGGTAGTGGGTAGTGGGHAGTGAAAGHAGTGGKAGSSGNAGAAGASAAGSAGGPVSFPGNGSGDEGGCSISTASDRSVGLMFGSMLLLLAAALRRKPRES
jgi:hypothetical protein